MAVLTQCKCKHPKLVHNKYTGQEIYTSCKKCIPCKRARQAAWVAKMQKERACHLYEFEIQLDYDDAHLPKYDFSSDGSYLIEKTKRLDSFYKKNPSQKKIYFNDLKFDTDADYSYFVERLNSHWTCIPHASVYDIQCFKKRLATYIKREITGKYSCFRSVFVSELGGDTLRPHYHGILWFDDERIAKKIDSLVFRAWKDEVHGSLGHARAKPSRGKLTSYIAKYITLPSDIPSFYEHPALRPLFLTSRKPPIGSLLESNSEIRWIFDGSSPQTVRFEKQGELYVPKSAPIGQNVENRLFPKCVSYGSLTDYDRFKLYKLAIWDDDYHPSYNEFLHGLFRSVFDGDFGSLSQWNDLSVFDQYQCAYLSNHLWFNCNDFKFPSQLIDFVSRHMECERTFQTLYSVSSRVLMQSKVFGVSVNDYISHILDYYNYRKPQYLLKRFYENQSLVLNQYENYDVRAFYPLSYMHEGVIPSEQIDSKLYVSDIEQKYKESMKNKQRKDYFEKQLPSRDPILYNLLNNYYAKKCDENAQAASHAWA